MKGGAAMRKMVIIALTVAGLVLIPLAGYPQSDQETSTGPPVGQPLVREGDFAMKLVNALDIGTAQNETDAESILASSGIAPKNGWIADYPITPDVLGDLQNSVAAAADSQRLPMEKDKALQILQTVAADFGLQVVAYNSDSYVQNSVPPAAYNGESPDMLNTYYSDYGPPVITYYPPPLDYYYLYAWVPYPFWFGGFFFTGYFCLHDFDRIIVVNHANRICTNHVFDPTTRTVAVIDPARRTIERSFGAGRGFPSAQARRDAEAIFNRSVERGRMPNAEHGYVPRGFTSVNPIPYRSREHFPSHALSNREGSIQRMDMRREGSRFIVRGGTEFSGSPSIHERSFTPAPATERGPSMQFRNGGAGSFSRGRSFGGFHGRGFGHKSF
jgi:hypothetical protein